MIRVLPAFIAALLRASHAAVAQHASNQSFIREAISKGPKQKAQWKRETRGRK